MGDYLRRDDLIPSGLPRGRDVLAEGRTLGQAIEIGCTRFLEEQGVDSEAEYKRRMRERGELMLHFQFGLSDWKESSKGLSHIHRQIAERQGRVDRFGICLDRIMGLPAHVRDELQPETGLKLKSEEEWLAIGRAVPVQPHLGDHMIGSPASVANLSSALQAGVTTVGNLAHYFAYDYPGWKDEPLRLVETAKALGIMAHFKDRGMILHSNLCDSPATLFDDRANYVGWAMLERYIAEDLVGAELVHCFGNMVTAPGMRLALLLAVDQVHGGETAGSHINANTMLSPDLDRNAATVSASLLFDMVGQLRNPTGHAVQALPLTEYSRIPSPDEIVQVQILADQLMNEAREAAEVIDMSPAESTRDALLQGGEIFRDNVLKGLAATDIDVEDPLEMLMALRRISGTSMEERFGAGQPDPDSIGGRRPIVPSVSFNYRQEIGHTVREGVRALQPRHLYGKHFLLAATDVHGLGNFAVRMALRESGCQVTDLGVNVDPESLADALAGEDFDSVCISTHNGMALAYAQKMLSLLDERGISVSIFMGGRLNQDEGGPLPRDVTEDLRVLGLHPCHDVMEMIGEADRLL